MITRFPFFCLVALSICLVANAGEAEFKPIAPADITGKKFILYSVDGKPFTAEAQPFIEFGNDMMVSGVLCNRFRGPATLENGILRSDGVVSTRMMCADENLSKFETMFLKQMENGLVLRMEEHELYMQNAETDLVFTVDYEGSESDEALAKALTGRKFVLQTMGGQQFEADDMPQPYIQFDQNLRVSGNACNQFSGQGRLRMGELRIDQLASTLKMCINPLLQQFENMFHLMLRSGARISLDGKTLRMDGQGLQLVFAEE